MTNSETQNITRLLDDLRNGQQDARRRLIDLVYEELHRMAQAQMVREPAGWTLQPTALVHEAYLRIFTGGEAHIENRRMFFATAARAMRRIRTDYARRDRSLKRGGQVEHDQLAGGAVEPLIFDQDPVEVLAIDEALKKLEEHDAELAEIVHLRYFAGLNVDQTAEVLGISARTVDNRWKLARAWLHRALAPS